MLATHPSFDPQPGPAAPNVLPVAVEMYAPLSANARRRWLRRMRRDLGARGITFGQKWGMFLFVGLHGDLLPKDRHAVVQWLVDQPQVASIVLHPILRAIDVLGPKVRFALDEATVGPKHRKHFRAVMHRLYVGALFQRDLGPWATVR